MQYIDKLPEGMLSISGGSFGWARSVVAKSWEVNGGNLIAAVEANHYNGPWEVAENTKKLNSYFRWSQGTQANGFSITGMAYSNHWNATDQIPQRTVDEGLLSRWGTLDPTTHGNSARYSLSTRWSQSDDSSFSKVEGYIIRSELNLWDMSTGILEHPELGDQFQNFDRRNIFGLNATHGWNYNIYGTPMVTRVGLQGRYDDIRNGLSELLYAQRLRPAAQRLHQGRQRQPLDGHDRFLDALAANLRRGAFRLGRGFRQLDPVALRLPGIWPRNRRLLFRRAGSGELPRLDGAVQLRQQGANDGKPEGRHGPWPLQQHRALPQLR